MRWQRGLRVKSFLPTERKEFGRLGKAGRQAWLFTGRYYLSGVNPPGGIAEML
ncbi:hypothetical protein [Clostridium botulinum]|uniref:hypothetical protein n=1 Tax=Clostridium botulinum TaxID=1491 RepID=UPI001CBB3AE7|nr:hypothetical protein [Clostridium botulinum]